MGKALFTVAVALMLAGCNGHLHDASDERETSDEAAYRICFENERRAGIDAPLARDVLACQERRGAEIREARTAADERRRATWRAIGESMKPAPTVHCTSTGYGSSVETTCR